MGKFRDMGDYVVDNSTGEMIFKTSKKRLPKMSARDKWVNYWRRQNIKEQVSYDKKQAILRKKDYRRLQKAQHLQPKVYLNSLRTQLARSKHIQKKYKPKGFFDWLFS